ncbi:MAG: hypothetical protein FWD66_11020 [Paludibacter sp.]|nr:hypothetical protein [Paludibacter sp.]
MIITDFNSIRNDKENTYRWQITKCNKVIKYVLMCFIVLFFSSCVPVMRVSMQKQKEYPSLESDAQFAVYKKPQQIPINYETLGKIKVVCTTELAKKSDTTKCDSISIFRNAESKAKEIGGNALLITKHKKPTFWNSYYFLNANVLKVFDFSAPLDTLYTKKNLRKYEIYGKGTWYLRFSIPYVNNFILQPNGERSISSTGFWGAAIGFDYYHQNTQYLSLIASGAMNYFLPVPMGADVNYGEEIVEDESCSSEYIGLTNNHRYRYFSLGYGLSYSHNSWMRTYNGGYTPDGIRDDIPPNKEYTDNTLGLLFTTYWTSKFGLSLGIIYRPNFIRLNTSPVFKYEHLISIDFAWRIRLKKGARQK